jgi:hypothetical protein
MELAVPAKIRSEGKAEVHNARYGSFDKLSVAKSSRRPTAAIIQMCTVKSTITRGSFCFIKKESIKVGKILHNYRGLSDTCKQS